MEIEYLKEFIVLSEAANLSDAAAELAVSESSLSRHIKALEDEFGCKLFDRSSRSLKINRYGKIVLPYAQKMVSLRQDCLSDVRHAGALRKATVVIVSDYYVGNVLAGFMKSCPHTVVNVMDSPNDQDAIKGQIRKEECAFAFIIDFADLENEFASMPFTEDFCVACLPTSHPLANRASIPLAALSEDRFVSFKTNSYADIRLKKLCHAAGFDPKISVTGDIGSSLVGFVRQHLGVALLRKKVLPRVGTNLDGVKLVELDPPIRFTVSIVWKKGRTMSEAEKNFLDYCKKHTDF